MEKRIYRVNTSLNQKEWEKMERMRTKTGLTRASVLRKLILQKAIQERPNADYRELRRTVDRIGNDFNQIAYKTNRKDFAGMEELKMSRRLLEEIKAEIERWKKIWL